MPNNIVPYESQVSNLTSLPDARANGDDFGAQVGQAIGQVGGAVEGLSTALREHQDRTQGVDGQLALAKARQDATQQLIQSENSPAAGSADFTTNFNSWFDDYQQKAAGGLPNNDKVQRAFQVGMADMKSELSNRAMQSQASQGAQLTVQKAQSALSSYVNTIQTDPGQYDASIAAGNKMIDGLGLQPADSGKLKESFTNTAIAGRFDAMFRAAKTPQAVDGIVNDLENGPWKDRMGSPQFLDMLRTAKAAQTSAYKLVNEQAQAGVSSLEDRIKGGVAIDPAEMSSVGTAVKQSNNPILLDKWARLQVQNDTTQRVKGMSSPAIANYVQSNKTGLADTAGPNTTTGRAVDGFNYLKSKYGLNDVQAMGVMSNVGRETGFMPRPGDGGTSDGYFQWHDDRMTKASAAGATGTDIKRAIDYAMSEPEGMAYLQLAQQGQLRNPDEASRAWLDVFEKPQFPDADQKINARWAQRLTEVVNGGKPLMQGPEGAPTGATPGMSQLAGGGPSEYEYMRAKAAEEVLKQRNSQISQGDQITAGADAGLYQVAPLNGIEDFQTRAQQSQVAQGFLGAKVNKPFTPSEVAGFDQVMQTGSLQDKQTLLQNVASMGGASQAAFKQIGEKSPVFEHIGGLSTVSPNVAQDVLRGEQAMQTNPDVKAALAEKGTGPGPGGTAGVFSSIVGNSLDGMPKDAYGARLAADALYVQRAGTGAPWDADKYGQAVRDVLGGKQGDAGGGVTTINGQPTAMPPGVNGDDFQTMLHSLQPQDLLDHSVGGGAPRAVSSAGAGPSQKFDGQITAGNIDLAARPQVKNADGTISTVRSMSFEEDGKEILIPTVSTDGKLLSDQQAIDLYHQTGQHLGKFDNADHATAYADALHQSQSDFYDHGVLTPADIASEGKFKTIGAGVYNVYMADGKPALGTGPNGFYAFKIDAGGVQSILQRQTQQAASQPTSNGTTNKVITNLQKSPWDDPLFSAIKGIFPDNFFRIPSGAEVHNALGGVKMNSGDNSYK